MANTSVSAEARDTSGGETDRSSDPISFASPDIDESDVQAVVEVLRSGWLTTGSRVQKFERLIAEASGVRHAVAVNSGTAALHLALDAIGLTRGDEVIVPTTTFTATAEVVRYFDAKPVLIDVEPDTLCIDPAAISPAVTTRTRAVIPVHFAGHAADMEAINDVAARAGISVIADAAHGFSGAYQGRPIGSLCDISALSFYATKTITTGEGGMLITDDDAVAERARIMSLHGMSRDAWNRYSGSGSWRYDVVAPGFKYNLTDLAAALGISQLQRVDEMLKRRTEIAHRYSQAFQANEAIEPPITRPGVTHSWHLYVLRLRTADLTYARDEIIRRIIARGVNVSVHFIPLHMFRYYRDTYHYSDASFPVAAAEFLRCISLPIHSGMSPQDVEDVISIVSDVVSRAQC